MRAWAVALGLAVAVAAAPASACLPPLPGEPAPKPPTDAELAGKVDRGFTNIVYGVVVRKTDQRGIARFRVIHVYRGASVRRRVIAIAPGPSLRSMNPCPGMVPDYILPLRRGDTGIFAWYDTPIPGRFLDADLVRAMFAAGYIKPTPRDQRVGTGSAPE